MRSVTVPAILIPALLALACNFPAKVTPAGGMPSPQSPTPDTAGPALTGEAPTEDAIPLSGLPVAVLEGGSGYIFSTGQVSKDDRDVWWNAAQLVPDTTCRMISLGPIGNPADILEIAFPAETPGTVEPRVGEGYALEVSCRSAVEYAVIKAVKIDADLRITFEWVYPFGGKVTAAP